MPQNSVYAITQTRDGYLWLGTEEGLVRFDGAQFVVFDKINTKEIGNNHISALLEDHSGVLWIGTEGGGLVKFDGQQFTRYTTEDGLLNDLVNTIYQDGRGNLWIGTGGGLNRLSDGQFVGYSIKDGLSDNNVTSICGDREGNLWVGTYSGLDRFKYGTGCPGGPCDGKFTSYAAKDGLPEKAVRSLYEDREGSLWIGTTGGLTNFKDGRLISYMGQERFSNHWVSAIQEDRDGNLWVGTIAGGLFRREGERFTSFSTKDGLPSDEVTSIYEDREGSLWVGTSGGGLNRFKDGSFTSYTMKEGLSAAAVYPILEDHEGSLWIGTEGGGLNRFKNGRFTFFTAKDGLAFNTVGSLFEDRRGNLWIGTDKGLNRFKNGKFTTYTAGDGLSGNSITAIYQDREGNLWFGTTCKGLNQYGDGEFTCYSTSQGLSNNCVTSILQDQEGSLWIGTFDGLNRFKDGRFTVYTSKDGLSNANVMALYEDGEGALWIGTSGGGLNRLKNGKFTGYTTREGLFDDVVFQILEDDLGHLWMSCNKGIFRVSKQQLNEFAEGKADSITSMSYGIADGMKSRECNGAFQPAGCKTRDGRLWFPTLKGVVAIDPSNLKFNYLPPPVLIQQVLADNKPADPSRRIEIAAGTNNLEIHYTALSLLVPEKVYFRYKLEGFDKDWVDAGSRRVAYYTNIPPGSYRFQVLACNNDGVWNEAGASVELSLKPLFYQTNWVYLMCVLGMVGLVVVGHRLRVRQMRARERQLVKLVEERTRQLQRSKQMLEHRTLELEEANEMLRRLSLQDELTGIANRRQFDDVLDREWRRAMRSGSSISLMMIDIDYFKAFNDAYGHQRGDECLRKVAFALTGALTRGGDLVARYGGEEFAVILTGLNSGQAAKVAERLRAEVEALAIANVGSPIKQIITVSIGVAVATTCVGQSPTTLIAAADQALYQAKGQGRNLVILTESDHMVDGLVV